MLNKRSFRYKELFDNLYIIASRFNIAICAGVKCTVDLEYRRVQGATLMSEKNLFPPIKLKHSFNSDLIA